MTFSKQSHNSKIVNIIEKFHDKKSLFIALISLYTSVPFGSTFVTAPGEPTLFAPCNYTLTSSREPITYLNLLKTAAQATLGGESTKFNNTLDDLIRSYDSEPNFALNSNDFVYIYDHLRIVLSYNQLRSYSFKQPESGSAYIESKIFKTDLECAAGIVQVLAYHAKGRFYNSN